MPRIDRSALNICAIAAGAATISHVIIICYHLINRPGKHLFIYGAGARASHRSLSRVVLRERAYRERERERKRTAELARPRRDRINY